MYVHTPYYVDIVFPLTKIIPIMFERVTTHYQTLQTWMLHNATCYRNFDVLPHALAYIFSQFNMGMQRITITLTCYHMRYHTFSFSLAWFGVICNALPRVSVTFTKKMYISIFFKKLTVTRGNPLQIAQNQANLRENV